MLRPKLVLLMTEIWQNFICSPSHHRTRPFLKWVRTQGRSPHASGKIQKYLAEHSCLRNTTSFIPSRYRKSRGTSHYITIYIIIIMSCFKYRLSWPSLAIRLSHPLLPASPLENILCPYRTVVDKFLLVVKHLHVCVKGSIGERRLWVHPYFSSVFWSSFLYGFNDGR